MEEKIESFDATNQFWEWLILWTVYSKHFPCFMWLLKIDGLLKILLQSKMTVSFTFFSICIHKWALVFNIFCWCLITNINNNVSVWFCFTALFAEKRISEEVDLNCTHFCLVLVVGPLSFDTIKAILAVYSFSWQYKRFLHYRYNFMTKKKPK